MRRETDSVAEIAARQHGRISRAQLLGAGVDADRVTRWVAGGRLHRVHRGVYALGHTAPSQFADYMAAVLAAGTGAVLSHLPAGYVLRLLRVPPPAPEVTIPTTAGRSRPGIVIHRSALPERDVFVLRGMPTTTVPRALLISPRALHRPS